jgi:hypothetical protein
MPICMTFIKVMQMHWIILLFCSKQVGLVVIISFHLFHLCNTLWTHWQFNIQPNSHMYAYIHYQCVHVNACMNSWMQFMHALLSLGDVIPQGQNTNIISNHIHIYITLIMVMHILWIILVFHNTRRPIEIISFYLFQQCHTLKTNWK